MTGEKKQTDQKERSVWADQTSVSRSDIHFVEDLIEKKEEMKAQRRYTITTETAWAPPLRFLQGYKNCWLQARPTVASTWKKICLVSTSEGTLSK